MKEVPQVIGVDPGKSIFQIHGVDTTRRVIVRRRLRRSEVLSFSAGVRARLLPWRPAPPVIIGHTRSARSGMKYV